MGRNHLRKYDWEYSEVDGMAGGIGNTECLVMGGTAKWCLIFLGLIFWPEFSFFCRFVLFAMIDVLAICYFLIPIWRIFVEVVDVRICIISRVELMKFNVFLSMCRAGLRISFVFLSSVLIEPSLLFL